MKPKVKLPGVGVALLLVAGMMFAGCSSGVSQEDYDAVISARDVAQAALAGAEADLATAQDQIAELQDQVADLEAEIALLQPQELPSLLSIADEFKVLQAAEDSDAQIAAFGELSTAINALGNAELSALLQEVIIGGTESEEAGAAATLDTAAYMLGVCAEAVEAFPAEVQPLLQLADELDALLAAEDSDAQIAAFEELNTAINAIGNAELSTLLQEVIIGGTESELIGSLATIDMVVWIMVEAAEASQ